MAGNVDPLVFSHDNGSYSNKIVSGEGEGSFLSMAAPVAVDQHMESLTPIDDPNTHDLDIFYTKDDRFETAPRRWVVGEQAEGRIGMLQTSRDMNRFDAVLFYVFVCAALRVAFPDRFHPAEDWRKNRRVIDRRWLVPVHMIGSIAPGYYGKVALLEQAAEGDYAFIDRKTDRLYCFRVEKCTGTPESFGGLATKLWDLLPNGQVVDSPNRKALERLTVAALDFGGRTTDYMVWNRRRVVGEKYGSLDVGLHQYVDNIIANISHGPLAGKLSRNPTRTEIMQAMRARRGNKGPVWLKLRDGEQVDIAEIVDMNMRIFALQVSEIYTNKLDSGQGIDVLLFMGGVSLIVRPYMEQVKHRREVFVSKDRRIVWMANALGGYRYGVWRLMEAAQLV